MKNKTAIFIVIFLAAFLRMYNLGTNPPALFGDETSYAYNAYSILKTGNDEHGNFLPLQFSASGDYKSAVPVYVLAFFESFLGLSPFSVRFPFALAGTATVLLSFFLAKEIFKNNRNSTIIGITTAFLLAVSPWHIHLSRAVIDGTLALFFFILGLLLFLKSENQKKLLIFSAASFSLSFFSYHPPKIFIPLFISAIIFLNRNWLVKYKKEFGIFLLLIFSTILLFFKLTLFDNGAARFTSVSIFNTAEVKEVVEQERQKNLIPNTAIKEIFHNKVTYYVRILRENYLSFFSPVFWFTNGEGNMVLTVGQMGQFYVIELLFLLLGLYLLIRKERKAAFLLLTWIFLAPIPAAFGGKTYVIRTMIILPAPQIIIAFGIVEFIRLLDGYSRLKKALIILPIIAIYTFSVFSYLERYHYRYPIYAGTWWGYDKLSAINYAKENSENYDQIILPAVGDMENALAFYYKIDPVEYQSNNSKNVVFQNSIMKRKFDKVYIGSISFNGQEPSLVLPPKTILISNPEENPAAGNFDVIRDRGDGRILFKIFKSADLLN